MRRHRDQISTVCRAVGRPNHTADLFKGKSAPNVGDNHFALLRGQLLQRRLDRFGVDGIGSRGDEPGVPLPYRFCLAPASPTRGSTGVHRPVANGPIQPTQHAPGCLPASRQFYQGILHDVFRAITPLARVEFQRSGVLIDQLADQFGTHRGRRVIRSFVHCI